MFHSDGTAADPLDTIPDTVQDAAPPRRRRIGRKVLLGIGLGLGITIAGAAFDQLTASASATELPTQDPAAVVVEAPAPVDTLEVPASELADTPAPQPALSDVEAQELHDSIAWAHDVLDTSAGRVADDLTRVGLTEAINRAQALADAVVAGTETRPADQVSAEAADILAQINAAVDGVNASIAAADEAARVAAEEAARALAAAEQQAAAAPAPAQDAAPAPAAEAPAASGADWTLYVDGYCGDASCAQYAVDTSSIALIDYGTGYVSYAGHNYGPAGVIASMGAGQTVRIEGVGAGLFRIAGTQYVSVNATTAEVYGLALQTCVGGDQMVVHYIERIG